MMQIKFEYNKSIPFMGITVYVLLMSVFTFVVGPEQRSVQSTHH